MRIDYEHLEYQHHVAYYDRLGLLTGDPERDAHWYCEAKETHAQTVSYAIREIHINSVEFSKCVKSAEAEIHLCMGVGRRTKFIWLSLQRLLRIIPPDHNEPLSNVDVDVVAGDLNVIYINIRGIIDNLAWCLVDLFGDEETKKLPRIKVNLFDKDFLKQIGSGQIAEFVSGFTEWNKELSDRRDPAAHRIPLSVPPAVLDEAAQKEAEHLWAEYNKAIAQAVRANQEGADNSAMFEAADKLYERLEHLGTFGPLFLHHPNENPMDIYPLVPQDIGQLVKVGRGLLNIISGKLSN